MQKKKKILNNRITIESIQERIIAGLISMHINKTYNNIRSDMQNTKIINFDIEQIRNDANYIALRK